MPDNGYRGPGYIHLKMCKIATDMVASEAYYQFPGTATTVCLLTTHHGHFEVGSSFFPDPSEFKEEQGKEGARADAMNRLMPIAVYLYREEQHRAAAGAPPIVKGDLPAFPPKPGAVRFIDEDLESMSAAMDDLTEADIAEVIRGMYAATRRDSENVEQKNHDDEGAALLAEPAAQLAEAGLITAEEHAKIAAGESYGYEIKRPEDRAEVQYLSLSELRGGETE
jgi:hypothetical protein